MKGHVIIEVYALEGGMKEESTILNTFKTTQKINITAVLLWVTLMQELAGRLLGTENDLTFNANGR